MTTSVDQGYAAWLKSAALTVSAASPDAARWAAQGVVVSATTPFATSAGTYAEGGRLLALLAGPLVQDAVLVLGRHASLVGRCITGVAGALDYDPAGEPLFVLGAQEAADDTTTLTVLRRLR